MDFDYCEYVTYFLSLCKKDYRDMIVQKNASGRCILSSDDYLLQARF